MDEIRCYYCSKRSQDFAEIIDHSIAYHNTEELKIKYVTSSGPNTQHIQTKNYHIVPLDIKKQNKLITPNSSFQSVNISNIPEYFLSPAKKTQKLTSTPKKCAKNVFGMQLEEDGFTVDKIGDSFDDMSLLDDTRSENVQPDESVNQLDDDLRMDEEQKRMYEQIIQVLPAVIKNLKDTNNEDTYLKFNLLLAENRLPLSNIAFLLFLDVVEWYSLENTHQMRYSDEVKQFWNMGHKLFKGKFLRFMSGWKNKGQLEKGHTKPENSSINFAVPSLACLNDSYLAEQLKDIKPGVLHEMINIVRADDPLQTKTFKLCVDGKKINVGVTNQKHGDVNLWGYEGPPTLKEMEDNLDLDRETLKQLSDIVEMAEKCDMENLKYVSEERKQELVQIGMRIIHAVSLRVKTLREVKQSKTITLERVKNACSTDAMKSKYSYALSAIKTYIYQINISLTRLLKAIDSIGAVIAECNGVAHLYKKGDSFDLSTQENYVCLTGLETETEVNLESTTTSFMKQRSALWFEMRKTAKVTGSTCHQALGLDGLKRLREHFESVFNALDKPQPSEESKKRMQHGVVNEINGIATLVAKVLPVYYPEMMYVEEGCEVELLQEKPFLVVSPDGSVRAFNSTEQKVSDAAYQAIEIKCPYPGKLYTTPVYYTMPWYYVCQVLSEMFVLKTNELLFLCYSEESTTVFKAEFDTDLWNEILKRLMDIYGGPNPSLPSRLPAETNNLKEQMKSYCKEKVTYIAEMPSTKAIRVCSHPATHTSGIGHNLHQTVEKDNDIPLAISISIFDLLTLSHDLNEGLTEAYSLSKHQASEVLVFLLSDLDRIHEREKQYAVPIGYALKGYSLTAKVMRQMLDDILLKCFESGLYVPAVSFDGQWSTLSMRSRDGFPLTMLQLQKDVYKQAKMASRKNILDAIKQTNVVKAETLSDVMAQAECNVNIDEEQQYQSPIEMFNSNTCYRLFRTSAAVINLLARTQSEKKTKDRGDNLTNQLVLLDTLPVAVADNIGDDILSKINFVATTQHPTENVAASSNYSETLNNLFQETSNITLEPLGDNEFMESEPCIMDVEAPTENDSVNQQMHMSEISTGEFEGTAFLTFSDYENMMSALANDSKVKSSKWLNVDVETFADKFKSVDNINGSFTKHELQVCIRSIAGKLKSNDVHFALSWNKDKLASMLYTTVNCKVPHTTREPAKSKRKRTLLKLSVLCAKEIGKFSKEILSVIYAEYVYPEMLSEWQQQAPFDEHTTITGIDQTITWYSMPEYVPETFTYLFAMLDCHHLFVNARVKCCSTGITEAGLKKDAWVKVATNSFENKSGLSIALVEDLVDKQSNAFAQKTFSAEVEKVMRENGDLNEANFCRMYREWYAAEDEPGLDELERIRRRLVLREWLLENVDFMHFPPPGTHIKGIPHIMFEGLLTNIERRIQISPFVKSGAFNPRALGSLEAENFFGEFQDLDPKGSGVIRPDDIPKAIGTACELIGARLDPHRKFFMHTSQAKVYPAHQLETPGAVQMPPAFFMTPSFVSTIKPGKHPFDAPGRALRKLGKRKSGEISGPSMSSRGSRPVRQYHRCDETKVLPHIRLGIQLNE